ncbi:MAG: hypothetical protein ACRERD_28770, partial [Candidatus Binatia bacterium]
MLLHPTSINEREFPPRYGRKRAGVSDVCRTDATTLDERGRRRRGPILTPSPLQGTKHYLEGPSLGVIANSNVLGDTLPSLQSVKDSVI